MSNHAYTTYARGRAQAQQEEATDSELSELEPGDGRDFEMILALWELDIKEVLKAVEALQGLARSCCPSGQRMANPHGLDWSAEDLAQRTAEKVLRKLHKFARYLFPEKAVRATFYRERSVVYREMMKLTARVPLEQHADCVNELNGGCRDVYSDVHLGEVLAALEEAESRLRATQRREYEAYQLCELKGMTQAKAGGILRIRREAVAIRMRKARQFIAGEIAQRLHMTGATE